MKPADIKPGTWLAIRDPFSGQEYHARFEEHLPSLGYGDPALNRLWVQDGPDWVGLSGTNRSGHCTFTDSELARLGRVLLDRACPENEEGGSHTAHPSPLPTLADVPGFQDPRELLGTQATPLLSGMAMAEWAERRRLEQLERLHKRLSDSQGQVQRDAQRAGAAMPGHSSIPRMPHTQSADSRDASGISACAQRASTVRTQRSQWLALSSRRATAHKARPLTKRERVLLALHPVRQWLPAPVRLLVERIYVAASLLSSYERVASKGNAKGGDHA